ncbi:MAG: TrkA family potassium uptake protein [Acidobacteriota bacterium]
MSKFVVIGLGSFGENVAKTLYEKGNDVLAIDVDKDKINNIKEFVSNAIVADARNKETLEELDVADSDGVIVSLGPEMEGSILIALHLKELGVKNIIVKALSEDHGKILELIGAHQTIYPEKDEAIRLANILSSKNILDFLQLSPDVSIEEIAPPEKFVGKSIKDLDLRNKYKIQIIAIRDTIKDELQFLIEPNFIIKESDSLVILGTKESFKKLESL